MEVRIAVPEEHVDAPTLNAGLEMNTRVNERLLRAGEAPTFDQAIRKGIRWREEPPGHEEFAHARKVVGRGWGDCDDLAPYRAATLRVTGRDPDARAEVFRSGPTRWHAVVVRGDGSVEDPSQTAGMRVRQGSRAAGIPPAVVGCMRTRSSVGGPVRPFTAVRRIGHGWMARTDLPFVEGDGEGISVTQCATTPALALAGSMRGVCVVGHCAGTADVGHIDKLWALQGLLSGESARDVAAVCGVETTKEAIQSLADIAPRLLDEIRAHRRATEGARGVPFDHKRAFNRAMGCSGEEVEGFFDSIAHAASSIVHTATSAISKVAHVAAPILSLAQGVISLVPGIGTGISSAIGAGLAILEGGGPLEIAIKAAYGAIPIPPGIRNITDTVLDAALSLIHTKDIGDAAIAAIRSKIPSGLPQQVFDTLAHIVLQAIHKKPTLAVATKGKPHAPIPPVKAPHVVKPKPQPAKLAQVHKVLSAHLASLPKGPQVFRSTIYRAA